MRGRHHASQGWGVLDALALVLSIALVVLGLLIAIGPTDGDPEPAPTMLPETTTSSPAVVVTP